MPPSIGDGALMFSTAELKDSGEYTFGFGCGTPYLNPDPAARWVRFVFNQLKNDCVEVRWRDKPTGPADFVQPLHGDAVLRCDFAAASCVSPRRFASVLYGASLLALIGSLRSVQ